MMVVLIAGCAGYRLGPAGGTASGSRSVAVRFFENRTLEARLPEAIAQALRSTLQLDGTYRLSSGEDADLVMTGVLLRYTRRPVAFQPKDVTSVREYEVRLTARVTVIERGSNHKLLDREVTGRTTYSLGNDLGAAERQVLPLLVSAFARNATTFLT